LDLGGIFTPFQNLWVKWTGSMTTFMVQLIIDVIIQSRRYIFFHVQQTALYVCQNLILSLRPCKI